MRMIAESRLRPFRYGIELGLVVVGRASAFGRDPSALLQSRERCIDRWRAWGDLNARPLVPEIMEKF